MINTKRILFVILICFVSLMFTSCSRRPSIITPPTVEKVHTIPEKPPVFRHDVYHEVAPGETIWRISKTYSVSAESILNTNNIRDVNDIKAGNVLLIPQAYPGKTVIPLFDTDRWKYIIVHHSATDFGNSFFFDKAHHRRGFNRGLGYDFVINNGTKNKKDGQIEVSPRWIKQISGAHCKASGMNYKGIGICLVGDFTDSVPTEKQMKSLVRLISVLKKYYSMPEKNILGHGQVPDAATECPGKNFPWAEFFSKVRKKNYKKIEQCKGPLQVIYVKK